MYFVSALPFKVFVLLFSGLTLCALFCLIYYRKRLSKTHKGMYIAATCLGFAVVGLRIGLETGLLSNSVFFRALIVTVVAFLVAFFTLCFWGYKHGEIEQKNMKVIKGCLIGLAICILFGLFLELID